MHKRDLEKLGVPNSCLDLGIEFCTAAAKAGLFRRYKPHELIEMVMADPQSQFNDSISGRFAKALAADARIVMPGPAPFKIWGEDQIDLAAINQMREACAIPVAVKGALMADSHIGYGISIGGVLGTINAVVPYAIGVDIDCRMKLTVLDVPPIDLERKAGTFEEALLTQTKFGLGCQWDKPRDHKVMDQDWSVSPVTKQVKDLARSQLGTSGGGNHFVEFGIVEFSQPAEGIEVGKKYVALMTHSGSRAAGSKVCDFYSKLAIKKLPSKYTSFKRLAWLYLDTEEGQEYWNAMNLMGDYAAANHDIIHRQISQHLGAGVALSIENHHNFAWKEIHDGIEMIVHRKGATPAGSGVLGVIPGSMADNAYIVSGLGNEDSMRSASHGAGRKYGRSAAKLAFNWEYWRAELKRRGVTLLSAGLDEVPGAYKPIDEVMARQSDLVATIASFQPKIVRMADEGPSED